MKRVSRSLCVAGDDFWIFWHRGIRKWSVHIIKGPRMEDFVLVAVVDRYLDTVKETPGINRAF